MKLLETILGKKNNIRVLRHLTIHKDWQFNITELAKDININKGVLSRLIEDLEKENLIKITRKGKIKLFIINKDNIFLDEIIIPLFEKEANFPKMVLESFVNALKNKTESIILYGSFAKGTAKLSSDIDTLVIINEKDNSLEKEIEAFKEDFLRKDLLLRVDVMVISELKNLYKSQEPFIKSMIKNHKVLSGKPIMELIE